jgi:hypothetical protein
VGAVRWAVGGLAALVTIVMLAAVSVLGSLFAGPPVAPAPAAVAGIPGHYLALYASAAATCPGLVDTGHGRQGRNRPRPGQAARVTSGTNYAGAMGPMQFLAATFAEVTARHPPPPGGAVPPSPYNPHDAIHTAAAYLCDNGARQGHDIRAALFTYNHSTTCVNQILDVARRYTQAAQLAPRAGAAATRPAPGRPPAP